MERLAEEVQCTHRANTLLVTQKNEAKAELQTALDEKAANLEFALAEQKAKLEEKCAADFDAAMEEEAIRLAADYKAQMKGIWDRAWELGWKAALRKVGVSGDDFVFRNPPKFPTSDPALHSIIDPPAAPGASSEAPLAAANAVPEAGPSSEAPPAAANAMPEAGASTEVPPAIPISEAASTDPKAILSEAGAPQGIDCNVEAIAP